MNDKFIQIKDAAEMLGVSKLTLRNWDRDGKLSALRHPISNYRVYRLSDIQDIIKKIESGEKPVVKRRPIWNKKYTLKVKHL